MTIPAAIIGEAVLSFLGLGVQPPTPSWGVMLSDAQELPRHGAAARGLPGPRDLLLLALVQPARRRPARRPRPAHDALSAELRCSRSTDLSRPVRDRRRRRAGGRRPVVRARRARGARHRRRVRLREEREPDEPAAAAAAERAASTARRRSTASSCSRRRRGRSARIRGREIAFVFQEPMTSLNPAFRVGRQIARGAAAASRSFARGARDRARWSCSSSSASRRPSAACDEYPHQLSGGMRQRVMIAMALACDPKVLVADEPTTALDVTIQAGILDLMRDIRERLGTAIVLITHNLGVVADIADRVLVMYAGRKVEEAPVHDLFAHPQHPYTIGLLGAIPRPGTADRDGRLREIPGRVPSLTGPWQACAFADRCPRADELHALGGSAAARGRARPPRRVLPSRIAMTETTTPDARGREPRQALPGRLAAARRRRRRFTRSTASRSRSRRERCSGSSASRAAASRRSATASCGCSSRRTGRSGSRAATSRMRRVASCGRSGARCTSSSRIRTRRSTHA